MTLNEIMASALQRLGRGNDPQTIEAYRDVFADYANEAVRQIAERFIAQRAEEVDLQTDDEGKRYVRLSDLSHGCRRVEGIVVGDKPRPYIQVPQGTAEFYVYLRDKELGSYDKATVYYRPIPATLENTVDVPEVPEYTHYLIVHWIVAMERAGGDPNMQGTSGIDFQLFNQGLMSITNAHYGEPRGNRLLHY